MIEISSIILVLLSLVEPWLAQKLSSESHAHDNHIDLYLHIHDGAGSLKKKKLQMRMYNQREETAI